MATSRQRSTSKTLEEWIEIYNKKIPEGFKRDEKFALFYLPEKGFAEVTDTGEMLVIGQVCGEFKFWRAFVEALSREYCYKWLGTFLGRPIKAYLRLAGFVPYKIEKTPLGDRYFCVSKKTGQKGTASPAGNGIYIATEEVLSLDF